MNDVGGIRRVGLMVNNKNNYNMLLMKREEIDDRSFLAFIQIRNENELF